MTIYGTRIHADVTRLELTPPTATQLPNTRRQNYIQRRHIHTVTVLFKANKSNISTYTATVSTYTTAEQLTHSNIPLAIQHTQLHRRQTQQHPHRSRISVKYSYSFSRSFNLQNIHSHTSASHIHTHNPPHHIPRLRNSATPSIHPKQVYLPQL